MSNTSYETLHDMTNAGDLEIYHLIAPPRSSSTALERALSQSPDTAGQINDPWSIYDDARAEQTYDYILDKVEAHRAGHTSGEPLRLVVKDIADYISPGDNLADMNRLVRHTIFLTREPLLSMESMMRIMAKEVPDDEGEAYAHRHGYDSWPKMQQSVEAARDYRPYDELYTQLFREEQPIHQLPEMQVPVLLATPVTLLQRMGYESRDVYAAAKGYKTWEELSDSLQTDPETIQACQDLVDENFRCRITGWTALGQHMERMGSDDSFDVVDATMFRALPHMVLPATFDRAGLRFGSEAVDWSASSKSFDADYTGSVPYYDRVLQSTGIAPPTEGPIPIERFPAFIRESLVGKGGALDIYVQSLKRIGDALPATVIDRLWEVTIEDKPLHQVDPVFYAACLKAFGAKAPDSALSFEALLDTYPEHRTALTAIEVIK